MCSSLEFIAEQFQEYADLDHETAFEDEGFKFFGDVPVFWTRYEDCFILDIEGIQYEVPRY